MSWQLISSNIDNVVHGAHSLWARSASTPVIVLSVRRGARGGGRQPLAFWPQNGDVLDVPT